MIHSSSEEREDDHAEALVGQLDFVDGLIAQRPQSRPSALMEIAGLVDWAPFEKLLSALPVAARGEPSDPALVMFKALLLQR